MDHSSYWGGGVGGGVGGGRSRRVSETLCARIPKRRQLKILSDPLL